MRDHRSAEFETEVTVQAGTASVAVRGEVDVVTAAQFRGAIEHAASRASRVEVDLREVTFMDASGVGVLCDGRSRANGSESVLVVYSNSPALRKLFEICGVSDLLQPPPGRSKLSRTSPST